MESDDLKLALQAAATVKQGAIRLISREVKRIDTILARLFENLEVLERTLLDLEIVTEEQCRATADKLRKAAEAAEASETTSRILRLPKPPQNGQSSEG